MDETSNESKYVVEAFWTGHDRSDFATIAGAEKFAREILSEHPEASIQVMGPGVSAAFFTPTSQKVEV